MAVMVKIPTPLLTMTGKDETEVAPGTIADLIEDLERQFPGIAGRISEHGKIRRFVNLYVNGEDIRFLQSEKTVTKNGDKVLIVPAIAGG